MKPIVNGSELNRFVDQFAAYAALQKKDVHVLFEEQCRGIAKNLFAVTPPVGNERAGVKLAKPGKKSRGVVVAYKKGLDAGRRAMEGDLKRAFSPTSQKRFESFVKRGAAQANQGQFSWVKSWYNGNLNARKRAKTSKLPVPVSIVNQVRKYLHKKQGWTPAGWMAAALKMGVRGVPGWISRHSAAGNVDFENTKEQMFFSAENATPHPNSKDIERNLAQAVGMQSNVIGRWLKDRAEKLAKGRIS